MRKAISWKPGGNHHDVSSMMRMKIIKMRIKFMMMGKMMLEMKSKASSAYHPTF